jgi:hypothetical protein
MKVLIIKLSIAQGIYVRTVIMYQGKRAEENITVFLPLRKGYFFFYSR